ncbi:ArnT family glycosyltransferase [Halodesulfovibrio marinisediminis]|uniref:4-amino-4-deoxy-L-arabinose transferase n=1 Tax=Halodesulfovibrio marinisediminis DSM 17456 TaxID=1121457 RepID=A0A1N6E833_9BACT|nr:glycosyltransferase family 39 protein [Halodesulfovibrio marinisediminis]SIN79131.1 4-amino-4-deoxy-L-arabinose transferase [Halodesulfovibrio marinisediminis DSM 17456]
MSTQKFCALIEEKLRNKSVPIFLLGLLMIVTTTVHLDQLDPEIMEARNFITANEIVETGNWLVPSLFGELRIAKPPLPTWMTSIVMMIAGTDTNLAVNRIPSAFAGLVLAVAFFGLTRSLTGSTRISMLSTAVLGTSYLYIFMVRRGTWDIHAVAYMTAMIWALDVLLKSKKFRPWLCLVTGVLFGLSFLSKGPVAFYALLLPFLFSELVVNGVMKVQLHWKQLLLVTGYGLVISASWYLVIMIMHPDAMAAMFSQETSAWTSHHIKEWWFYLPQVPAMLGLWAIPAVLVFISPYARPRLQKLIPYNQLLLWTVGIVVLLSVIPEKKVRYLLPVIVPLSMLVGGALDYWLERGFAFAGTKRLFYLYTILGSIVLFAVVGVIWIAGEVSSFPLFMELWPVIVPLLMLVGGTLDYWLERGSAFAGSNRLFYLYTILGSIVLFAAVGVIWIAGEVSSLPIYMELWPVLAVCSCLLLVVLIWLAASCHRPRLLLGCLFTTVALVMVTAPPYVKTVLPYRGTLPIQQVRNLVGKTCENVYSLTSLKLQNQWVFGKPAKRIVADDLASFPVGVHVVVSTDPVSFPEKFTVKEELVARYLKRDPLLIYKVTVTD